MEHREYFPNIVRSPRFAKTGWKMRANALHAELIQASVKRTLNNEAEVRGGIADNNLLPRRFSDDISVKHSFLAGQQVAIHFHFLICRKI
jgi:hypothetical protein